MSSYGQQYQEEMYNDINNANKEDMKADTMKAFELHLNGNSPEQGSDKWIIGGTIRMGHMWQSKYGTALRTHDILQFRALYNDWKRQQ